MSSSGAECRGFSGRKLQKKPSFSETCSRLSLYLKEKGSFGDLSLGMTCNSDVSGVFAVSRQPTVMNLFPCEEALSLQDVKPKNNMVPRLSSFSSSSSSGAKEEVEKTMETKSVKVESQFAPLTIFYGGQVMVFDDFPVEKAKQVIDLANQTAYTQNIAKNQKEVAKTTGVQEPIQTNTSSLACELPIARRASLHRFLEKRKDRITSKAPYQIDGSTEASSKPNTSWLGSQ